MLAIRITGVLSNDVIMLCPSKSYDYQANRVPTEHKPIPERTVWLSLRYINGFERFGAVDCKDEAWLGALSCCFCFAFVTLPIYRNSQIWHNTVSGYSLIPLPKYDVD